MEQRNTRRIRNLLQRQLKTKKKHFKGPLNYYASQEFEKWSSLLQNLFKRGHRLFYGQWCRSTTCCKRHILNLSIVERWEDSHFFYFKICFLKQNGLSLFHRIILVGCCSCKMLKNQNKILCRLLDLNVRSLEVFNVLYTAWPFCLKQKLCQLT